VNPDPLRPVETDLDRVEWLVGMPPLVPDDRLGFLLALACGFIAGVLVMWVVR
jgi:hypothetical protein